MRPVCAVASKLEARPRYVESQEFFGSDYLVLAPFAWFTSKVSKYSAVPLIVGA